MTYGDIRGQWFGISPRLTARRARPMSSLSKIRSQRRLPALFLRLLHEHPSVCDCMLRRLVGCVRDLTERIYDFSTLGVQNRVHAELLRLAAGSRTTQPVSTPRRSTATSPAGSARIGNRSRELSTMAKQGLVQRSDSALVVPDVARLEKIVAEVRRSE